MSESSLTGGPRRPPLSTRMAASQAITHAQRVTRLYRHALKNSLSWCIDRATWRAEALEIRARFDGNKHVQDRRLAQSLVQQGEDELQGTLHPDPYLGEVVALNTVFLINAHCVCVCVL